MQQAITGEWNCDRTILRFKLFNVKVVEKKNALMNKYDTNNFVKWLYLFLLLNSLHIKRDNFSVLSGRKIASKSIYPIL